MLDTMTFTKIAGGLCGALLVLLLGKWAAEELYHVGGHGKGEAAYVIEVEETETAAAEEEVPFEELLAAADIGKGKRVFNKCSACHKLETGKNGAGPYLYGLVGRDIATAEGFGYSGALASQGDMWSVENLNAFLENPKGWAPGTSMSFAGLKKPEDRANVIAYIDSVDD